MRCRSIASGSSSVKPTVHVGNLIGTLSLSGIRGLRIASNPWRRATVPQLALGNASQVQFYLNANPIASFGTSTITFAEEVAPCSPGQKLQVAYRNARTNDNAPFEGAVETPGGDGGTGSPRRCYAELCTVQAYDSASRTATLTEALARTYEVPVFIDPDLQCLRAFNVTSVVAENITVEGIDIVIPAYVRQGGSQNQGVSAYQCIDLTLRDIRVKGALGQGIMVSTCRHVLVEGCTVEMAPFYRLRSLLYGVEVQFSHYVTVQDHTTIFARYGTTISRGSTNVTVQRLISKSIHETGATADIHGGDCKNLTFRDFETVNRGLTLGNPTWTRGADGVTVENITGIGIAFVGSLRNVTVNNCQVGVCQFLDPNPDTGNGFNNATGASQGHCSQISIADSTFDYQSSANDLVAPLTFSHLNSIEPNRVGLEDIQFSNCEFLSNQVGNVVVRMQRGHMLSFTGFVSFKTCGFRFRGGFTGARAFFELFSPQVGLGLNGKIGPCEFAMDNCVFEDGSQATPAQIFVAQRLLVLNAKDCTYIRNAPPVTLDASLLEGPPKLFTVVTPPLGGDTEIHADGTQVWPI